MPVSWDIAIAVLLVLAVIMFWFGLRQLGKVRLIAATGNFALALSLMGFALLIGSVSLHLHTYHRLTAETDIARISFEKLGEQHFEALVRFPTGKHQRLELYGDEWQLDGQMLKFKGWALLVGFNNLFRLERLSGRYANIEQERSAKRTVYDLSTTQGLDLWALSKKHDLPVVDAVYGSGTYLPMAHDHVFDISLGQSGLIARKRQ